MQRLYEAMYHEPYIQAKGRRARIDNNPECAPVTIEKRGMQPGYGEIVSVAQYGLRNGYLREMEFTIVGGDYYPIGFRNDYLGRCGSVFGEAGINQELQDMLAECANQWMRHIADWQNLEKDNA